MKSKVPSDVRSLIEAVKAADHKTAFSFMATIKMKKVPKQKTWILKHCSEENSPSLAPFMMETLPSGTKKGDSWNTSCTCHTHSRPVGWNDDLKSKVIQPAGL